MVFSGCNRGHKKKPVACDPTAIRSIKTLAYTSDFSEFVLHPFVVLDNKSANYIMFNDWKREDKRKKKPIY